MKKMFLAISLLCGTMFLSSCQSYQSHTSPASTINVVNTRGASESTLTPVMHTEEPVLTPKNTISPSDTPKIYSDLLISTPTIDLDAFVLCSPLQHETIASLVEIVTDPYNPPPPGRDERHHGVDFSYYHRDDRDTIEGEGIQAIMTGSVAAVITDRPPYGNMVIIETPRSLLPDDLISMFDIGIGESLYHLYAHMQSASVLKVGETVECGQALGSVGVSGYNIVNPHLHLETRIGITGVTFPGMAFYTTDATPDEMENYRRWRTSGEFRHFDPMSLFSWFSEP